MPESGLQHVIDPVVCAAVVKLYGDFSLLPTGRKRRFANHLGPNTITTLTLHRENVLAIGSPFQTAK